VVDGLFHRLCVRAHVEFAERHYHEFYAIRTIAKRFSGETRLIRPRGPRRSADANPYRENCSWSPRQTTHELAPRSLATFCSLSDNSKFAREQEPPRAPAERPKLYNSVRPGHKSCVSGSTRSHDDGKRHRDRRLPIFIPGKGNLFGRLSALSQETVGRSACS